MAEQSNPSKRSPASEHPVHPGSPIDAETRQCQSPESNRRQALLGVGAATFAAWSGLQPRSAHAWWETPGAWAEELATTAPLTEGPFYPDSLPLDTDNDLLRINDGATPAMGIVTHFTGRVLSKSGQPLRNATVEIWQCDADGSYIHSKGQGEKPRDVNFQGFGRFLTDSKGRYYFRTIKPVPYGPRTPHIHVAVNRGERRLLTTQALIRGEAQNQRDGVFRAVKSKAARDTLLVDFKPIKNVKVPQFEANFNIVIGRTAREGDDGEMRSDS